MRNREDKGNNISRTDDNKDRILDSFNKRTLDRELNELQMNDKIKV